MGRFERAIATVLKRSRKGNGIEATYHKKDGSTLDLVNVSKGEWKWRFNDDNLMSQHIETIDFIFDVDQFADFRRGTNEPFAGDLIKLTAGDLDQDVFDVISVNKERVWRFIQNSTLIRVHTQFLRREAI